VSDDKVAIAYINKCWGVKGEVIAEPLTSFPQRFKKLDRVSLSGGRANLELKVEWTRSHGKKIIFKFKEIDDRNEADRLRNSYIEIDKKEIYSLPADQYYIFQLVGLEVMDIDKGKIGIVDDVWEYPASDIFVVRSEKGLLLIPGIKEIIKKIDLENNRMEVKLLPGMEFEAE
jgi:16S rRNA processing protein RimM